MTPISHLFGAARDLLPSVCENLRGQDIVNLAQTSEEFYKQLQTDPKTWNEALLEVGKTQLQQILDRPTVKEPTDWDPELRIRYIQDPDIAALKKAVGGIFFCLTSLVFTLRAWQNPTGSLDAALALVPTTILAYSGECIKEGIVYLTRDTGLFERMVAYKTDFSIRASFCTQKIRKVWRKFF